MPPEPHQPIATTQIDFPDYQQPLVGHLFVLRNGADARIATCQLPDAACHPPCSHASLLSAGIEFSVHLKPSHIPVRTR
jgi:hypothetical protein